jgi:hypothetical protein
MKKQLYTMWMVLGCCLASPAIFAQCTCSDGSTPDSVINNFTLSPTSNFSSTISFPQFNPSIGTLTCVKLSANVTAVANLSIRNLDSVQRDYQFMYTQAVSFSGPGGLSAFGNTNLFYGPTTLDPYGQGIDSVHYGPDTPFKNYGLTKQVSNVTPYLGTGTVNINYTNTGSTLLLQGSNNYQSTVSTFTWGTFKLSYFWCAASLLPTGMKNFYANRKEQEVELGWTTENEVTDTHYEIQFSLDGHRFTPLKGQAQRHAQSPSVASYVFQYPVENNFTGKIFFRIKQIKPTGQTGYSTIKAIDFSGKSDEVLTIAPNPVLKDMMIGFKAPQTGKVQVELFNAIGQQTFRQSYTLNAQVSLGLHLDQQARPGIYYLRVRNVETNEQFMQRIIIR